MSHCRKLTTHMLSSFCITLGTVLGTRQTPKLSLPEEMWHRHLLVAGGTRNGKSRLLQLICRQLWRNRRGFAFIDPHSDTADEIFSELCFYFDELGFQRENIHYLNPKERAFCYDPFRYNGVPRGLRYCRWLHAKIKAMVLRR